MEISVVIDSCVFIEYFRSKNKENTRYAELSRQGWEFCVSAVAKYEVLSGASDDHLGEWQRIFENVTVLPFSDTTVGTARMIHRQLKRESKLLDLGDILIAATAIADDLPLATLNRNHFERIRGLKLV